MKNNTASATYCTRVRCCVKLEGAEGMSNSQPGSVSHLRSDGDHPGHRHAKGVLGLLAGAPATDTSRAWRLCRSSGCVASVAGFTSEILVGISLYSKTLSETS